MARSRKYSSVYKRKNQRGSSRLLKKEERKMRKQTALYILLGLALLLLFIFILLPGIIRFFFAFFDKESPFEEVDDVPPQVPTLSSTPPEATFSAQLDLTGFAEADSTVVFVLNGQELNQTQADEEGQFSEALSLLDGDNELTLYGLDQAGNESLQSKTYHIALDQEVPEIEIIQPEADSKIEFKKNRNTPIDGQTEANARVYLNDRLILADSEGHFQSTYYLDEGENQLHFVVTDQAGNQNELTIKVNFRL